MDSWTSISTYVETEYTEGYRRLTLINQVTTPRGDTIYTNFKKSQGSFELTAQHPGKYTYCFSNQMSSYARKILR